MQANELWEATRFGLLLTSDKLVAVIILALGINSAGTLRGIFVFVCPRLPQNSENVAL